MNFNKLSLKKDFPKERIKTNEYFDYNTDHFRNSMLPTNEYENLSRGHKNIIDNIAYNIVYLQLLYFQKNLIHTSTLLDKIQYKTLTITALSVAEASLIFGIIKYYNYKNTDKWYRKYIPDLTKEAINLGIINYNEYYNKEQITQLWTRVRNTIHLADWNGSRAKDYWAHELEYPLRATIFLHSILESIFFSTTSKPIKFLDNRDKLLRVIKESEQDDDF